MAGLQAPGAELRVRVADISQGGAKIRAGVALPEGSRLRVELPNLGWIGGTVAWCTGQHFGVRFDHDIDPAVVRQPVTGSYRAPPIETGALLRHVA